MMDIVMMAVASKDKIAAPMMIPVITVFPPSKINWYLLLISW